MSEGIKWLESGDDLVLTAPRGPVAFLYRRDEFPGNRVCSDCGLRFEIDQVVVAWHNWNVGHADAWMLFHENCLRQTSEAVFKGSSAWREEVQRRFEKRRRERLAKLAE